MRVDSTFRVMWLLNHSSARKFELSMLQSIGVKEVFTPKIFPADVNFRSASVDFSGDEKLTIPREVLERLNSVNWYESATDADWRLASHYFDVCFFILYNSLVLKAAVRGFAGALLWRAYGLPYPNSYASELNRFSNGSASVLVKSLGERLFFAQAYSHLSSIEPNYLASRALYLPLGMSCVESSETWRGSNSRIFFVCPDIAFNPYYENIYKSFVSDFGDFPYSIGGSQPLPVNDPNVLGFMSSHEYDENMREMRLMFYSSQEKFHIHYHPFEAVRAGMPLVFMAGGMLDQLGGEGLPGRCKTVEEARKKIRMLLKGNSTFIEEVRASQVVLLEAMRSTNLEAAWRDGFAQIKEALDSSRAVRQGVRKSEPKRLAVVIPLDYKGGSLRGAKLIAEAILHGSRATGESAELVFAHLDNELEYSVEDFADLPSEIKRRPIRLRKVEATEARRAMRYSGHEDWEPNSKHYLILDDGINQLIDCDLWLIISDRLLAPILPLRPIVHMVYDYIQRYVPVLAKGADQPFLEAARSAERVFVTTNFTFQDALQYGGICPKKVVKLPMLSPRFYSDERVDSPEQPDYFIWTTNSAPHKNHKKALEALNIYYGELAGKFHCVVTGVNSDSLLTSSLPHLKSAMVNIGRNTRLRNRLTFAGNLPDEDYRRKLSGSAFLWHPGRIDNGSFSVIEAASLGVPSLSSDYPAMREINEQFQLGLNWTDPDDPRSMAHALKEMEQHYAVLREKLPTPEVLDSQSVQRLAGDYWKAIRECL